MSLRGFLFWWIDMWLPVPRYRARWDECSTRIFQWGIWDDWEDAWVGPRDGRTKFEAYRGAWRLNWRTQ